MKTAKELIELAGEIDEIHTNLLLTRRCGYQCFHCMYAAGPKMPGDYMTPHDLFLIKDAMKDCRDFIRACRKITNPGESDRWVNQTFNLVGGEPTLDMEKFAEICECMEDSGGAVEMTTNGWWLEKPETLVQFWKAVRGLFADDNMSVRISSTPWHDEFRSERLQRMVKDGDTFRRIFSPEGWYEYVAHALDDITLDCPYCGEAVAYSDYECPHCARGEQELQELKDAALERKMEYWHWCGFIEQVEEYKIHVDLQNSGSEKISPVGRARKNRYGNQDGRCHITSDVKFTFMPGAQIYDVCCNGGHVPIGPPHDGIRLLLRRMLFMDALHREYPDPPDNRRSIYNPNPLGGARCFNCPGFYARWSRENKERVEDIVDEVIGIYCTEREKLEALEEV